MSATDLEDKSMSKAYSAVPVTSIQRYRLALSRQFAGQGGAALGDNLPQVLDTYLDCLEALLGDSLAEANISQIQEMLLELSCMLRGPTRLGEAEVLRFLERLIALYAKGVDHRRVEALTHTAADYAEVIEAASMSYPDYDYSEAVSQLLCYMGQLYHTRRGSWKVVYEHITSMPASVEAIRYLNNAFFSEIRQWAEEGVGNLFQIRRDHQEMVAELEGARARLEQSVDQLAGALPGQLNTKSVIHIDDLRKRREVNRLRAEQARLTSEIDGKYQVLALIDENIDEFETKIKDVRRSYSIRLVHSA